MTSLRKVAALKRQIRLAAKEHSFDIFGQLEAYGISTISPPPRKIEGVSTRRGRFKYIPGGEWDAFERLEPNEQRRIKENWMAENGTAFDVMAVDIARSDAEIPFAKSADEAAQKYFRMTAQIDALDVYAKTGKLPSKKGAYNSAGDFLTLLQGAVESSEKFDSDLLQGGFDVSGFYSSSDPRQYLREIKSNLEGAGDVLSDEELHYKEMYEAEIQSNPIKESVEEAKTMSAAERKQAAIDRANKKSLRTKDRPPSPSSARTPEERQAILDAGKARQQAAIDAAKARSEQKKEPIIKVESNPELKSQIQEEARLKREEGQRRAAELREKTQADMAKRTAEREAAKKEKENLIEQRRQEAIERGKRKGKQEPILRVEDNPEIDDATRAEAQVRTEEREIKKLESEPSHFEPPPDTHTGPVSSINFVEEADLEPPLETYSGPVSPISFDDVAEPINTGAPISQSIDFIDDSYFDSLTDPGETLVHEAGSMGEDIDLTRPLSRKPTTNVKKARAKKQKKVSNFKKEAAGPTSGERLEALDTNVVTELTESVAKPKTVIGEIFHNPESSFNKKSMSILDEVMGTISDSKTSPMITENVERLARGQKAVATKLSSAAKSATSKRIISAVEEAMKIAQTKKGIAIGAGSLAAIGALSNRGLRKRRG